MCTHAVSGAPGLMALAPFATTKLIKPLCWPDALANTMRSVDYFHAHRWPAPPFQPAITRECE